MLEVVTRSKAIARPAKRRLSADQMAVDFEVHTARLMTAIENIPQGLCFFDANHRLIISNRRYAEIYGLSPDQIRPGMTLRRVLALRIAAGGFPDMTPDEYIAWTQAQTTAYSVDGTIIHLRNGRAVSVRYQPIPYGGWVSTHEDVTERLLSEAALRQGNKLRTVGQMAEGVAHDVNNLLMLISGSVEDALSLPGDCGGARPQLEAAMQSINSAADLLQQLLGLSRPRRSRQEAIELNAWLIPLRDMVARMLGPLYRIELRTDPDLPACPVDHAQLESAVLNLILNARDAMPRGGVIIVQTERVEIADGQPTERGLRPGAYIAITVRDSGHGMPPDVAARAFEPFFSSKPAGTGTGLGLTMVQRFAEHAGGGASLRSAPGAGTSVQILLPTSGVANAPAPAQDAARNGRTLLAEHVRHPHRAKRVRAARVPRASALAH
jgi:signal transduction histidine kinase